MKKISKKIKITTLIIVVLSLITCNNNSEEEKLTFKVYIGGAPSSLDPHLADETIGARILEQVFSGLLTLNTKTGKLNPGLAKSWKASEDKKTYQFYLRDNLVWSDGVPITAQGIRKSFLRILDKTTESTHVDMLKSIIKNGQEYFDGKVSDSELGIKAIDEKILEITLTSPKPYFLELLLHHAFMPVPIHTIEKYKGNWTNPENMVVSGPFKLKKRLPNEKIIFEKNEHYYNAKEVELEELVYITSDNDLTVYNMYKNNEIDAIFNSIPPDIVNEIKLQNDYYQHKSNAIYLYSFNTKIKPLDNAGVREALTLAIDRETLAYQVLNDGTVPTREITPNLENYNYDKKLALFDPEKSKKLLTKAGYPNGKGFPILTLKYNTNETHKKVASFIQNQWKKILNINIILTNENWPVLTNSRNTGNFEIIRIGRIGEYLDPHTYFTIFTSENSQLASYRYSNLEFDKLIKESDFEKDPIKRKKILRKAEEIIIEKDFPAAPIYIYSGHYLFRNDKWTGWSPNVSEVYYFSELKSKNAKRN
ncbi:peptide ABC transporter substrate-binding protein [Borreliella lusitaniae]|uniref:peptide ABC transporter substrate-binding protein n=1 Tax=Borreliella lusitaniae TaxID=100177 RepID=UPI002648DFFB|nr:peptide ABC transporter substrate-binding protein [Borreliella lusitaniae]WKC85746.1 peptide ABC transporter substrate-binding protein [Borreliella lusitaniae]